MKNGKCEILNSQVDQMTLVDSYAVNFQMQPQPHNRENAGLGNSYWPHSMQEHSEYGPAQVFH